ncbi:MAG: radical SAM protein [Endomicrobium sp.]|jgi:putative pyruvate formate lyase activating enzyme|nr:radical SAM protein [Endomicrobium sp.]
MLNLESNEKALYRIMSKCAICPKKCGSNRNKGHKGVCKAVDEIVIASICVHRGEEPPISAINGSGAVFFSNCTLSCIFCQNYPISQLGNGKKISVEDLVNIMLDFQLKEVHNINFVTPTHYSAQIVRAVLIARKNGLKLPIIYNCSGYEEIETLKLLEGIVDIYLPDIKYSNNETAYKYSGVKDYVEISRVALKEMNKQVGTLKVDDKGVARKGLIVRHLVLPGNIENTKKVLEFVVRELPKDTFVSLMSQYQPAYKSNSFKELSRSLSKEEYEVAVNYLRLLNFRNGWIQNLYNF